MIMRRNKKILICVFMLVVIAAAGIFGSATVTRDGRIPAYSDNTNTDAEDDLASNTDAVYSEADSDSENAFVKDGSFSEYSYALDARTEQEINRIIESMSIREKVGQVFFIKNDGRFDETILEEYPVGGIILFSGDFKLKSAETLTADIEAFQNNSRYPLLIGTDEEGGSVIRVSRYGNLAKQPFASPRSLYASGGYEAIIEDTKIKSELLLSYGINVNFAPVCDVSLDVNDFMYDRSFGDSPAETAEYVRIVVENMNDAGIGSVLKHFPGYGNNGDTHKNVIYDGRSYEQFETVDFLPFISGIEEGADCVLVSHNIVECMDSELPASLSYNVHSILRDELRFTGVIITDDLMMDGVSSYVNDEESVVLAIQAGNDMILSTDYAVQYNALLEAVNNGIITEKRLDESIRRILRWKYRLGLFE